MEHAASAVGLAAFGIQLCQGLVTYYEDWKSYGSDISSTYESIADVGKTFSILKSTLERGIVDPDRSTRVTDCLKACENSLNELQEKLKKLQTSSIPSGFRKKAWSELQRLCYPFQARTLKDLKTTTSQLQANLGTALEVLHLDLSITSHGTLSSVDRGVCEVALRTAAIEDSTNRLAVQGQTTLDGVQDLLARQQIRDFGKIVDWLSPANPWTSYDEAHTKLKASSGVWLLQLDLYQQWKAAQVQHIWLNGKSGCGKSVLCSIVIEDIRKHCAKINAGFAMFYFTFSDAAKQSYRDLLLSLVAQLCWKEPGCTTLRQAFEKSDRSVQTTDSLEGILVSSIAQFDKVFAVIDGLDECLEHDEVRASVLTRIEKLTSITQNLFLLVTSQPLPEIACSMTSLRALPISIDRDRADADICQYVESELSSNTKLKSLDSTTKSLLRDTIVQKADGSFRWADCLLGELKQLKSMKPKHIKAALNTLPRTLDATYERMLMRIDDSVQEEAFTALRWLAFAVRPLTLAELVDACITDPAREVCVDLDERGGPEDVLEILSGLVIVDNTEQSCRNDLIAHGFESTSVQHTAPAEVDMDLVAFSDTESDGDTSGDEDIHSSSLDTHQTRHTRGNAVEHDYALKRNHRVRLAHFSVKEFLLSARICESKAASFALQEGREQAFLAQSCLTYLMYCSDHRENRAMKEVCVELPLARYAAKSWHHHSSSQVFHDASREVQLLTTDQYRTDWLRLDMPHRLLIARLGYHNLRAASDLAISIYCASSLGLEPVVRTLYSSSISAGNTRGRDDNALLVASTLGFEKVVETLLEHGAYVDAHADLADSPLAAALYGEHEKVVEILLRHGARIEVRTDHQCSALQLAAGRSSRKNIELLLAFGADINASTALHCSPLITAIRAQKDGIVELLLDLGADMHARGAGTGNALEEAAYSGNAKLVKVLLSKGADLHAMGGPYVNALHAAVRGRWLETAEILLSNGADAYRREYGSHSALEVAARCGNEEMMEMLLKNSGDVNANRTAAAVVTLILAADRAEEQIVRGLLKHCAAFIASERPPSCAPKVASGRSSRAIPDLVLKSDPELGLGDVIDYRSITLLYAADYGFDEIVQTLLEAGVNFSARDDGDESASQDLGVEETVSIINMLLENGADADARGAQGGECGNALAHALCTYHNWELGKPVSTEDVRPEPIPLAERFWPDPDAMIETFNFIKSGITGLCCRHQLLISQDGVLTTARTTPL